jgi:hypothetical protein
MAFGPQPTAGIDEFIPSPAWGRDMALVNVLVGPSLVVPSSGGEDAAHRGPADPQPLRDLRVTQPLGLCSEGPTARNTDPASMSTS